jgi:hypothetical protein
MYRSFLRTKPVRQRPSYAPLHSARLSTRATEGGAALLEVLIAIFMTGIGLLALLTLFPIGAIEMAQAIPDDRTAAVAADAMALGEAGEELVSRTTDFVRLALSSGSADPHVAARLSEGYERLAGQAEGLEVRLQELRQAFPRDEIQPYLGPLLAQLRSIRWRIIAVSHLLSLLETMNSARFRQPSTLPGSHLSMLMVIDRRR